MVAGGRGAWPEGRRIISKHCSWVGVGEGTDACCDCEIVFVYVANDETIEARLKGFFI